MPHCNDHTTTLKQLDSLETERESLTERATAALQAEKRATADLAGAQSRTKNAEQALESRVRELEEEAARLRREVAMGADAAEASVCLCCV